MKGMLVMYSYKGKIGGAIIAAIGLIGIISQALHPWALSLKIDADKTMALLRWITLAGLLTVGFSKEKYDDDRAVAIRLKALQIAVTLQQAVILGMALTFSLHPEPLEADILFALSGIGIIMYLLLFHLGLYFDILWDYDDKSTKGGRLKSIMNNKRSLIVYLLLGALMLLLLTIFEF